MLTHSHVDITLTRRWFTERTSIGEFFFQQEAVRNCYILEDVARAPEVKIPEVTCIPAGDYWLKITFSQRFQRLLPLIYNEEFYKDPTGRVYYDFVHFGNVIFTGVRIHIGNFDYNTEACQLPGLNKGYNKVLNSKDAFDPLYDKIYSLIGETGKLAYRITHNQAA